MRDHEWVFDALIAVVTILAIFGVWKVVEIVKWIVAGVQ